MALSKEYQEWFLETIAIFGVAFGGLMGMRYIYLRLDLQKSEFSSNFREQPEMLQMMREISEIKKLLKESDDDNVCNIDSE